MRLTPVSGQGLIHFMVCRASGVTLLPMANSSGACGIFILTAFACLISTSASLPPRRLIKKYTDDYGKPFEYKAVDTTYRDPYKDHHWGYDVIYAKWKTDKIKFKIEFTFMGGKGEYHFLVKMGFFDKDYKYWD